MELYSFIDSCANDFVTLKDVEKLNIGDCLDVVMWDRNFEDYDISDNIPKDTAYSPTVMFRENRGQLVYKGSMRWDIRFAFGETFEHPVHLEVSGSSTPTEWEWRPIENEKELFDVPKNAYVGWRGPIMLWDTLKEKPPVMWTKI